MEDGRRGQVQGGRFKVKGEWRGAGTVTAGLVERCELGQLALRERLRFAEKVHVSSAGHRLTVKEISQVGLSAEGFSRPPSSWPSAPTL